MIDNLSVAEFLRQTASSSPVPGGGCVAALAAAAAAGLVEMVAQLSAGKKASVEIQQEMTVIAARAASLRSTLQENIEKDAEAYKGVMKAFKMAKECEAEKKDRAEQLEKALREASCVPLEVARGGMVLLDLCEVIVRRGNRNAWTDAAVAVMMARSAVLGAADNVEVNIRSMHDTVFVAQTRTELQKLRSQAIEKEQQLLAAAAR